MQAHGRVEKAIVFQKIVPCSPRVTLPPKKRIQACSKLSAQRCTILSRYMSLAFDGSLEYLQQLSKELARSQEARIRWLQDYNNTDEVVKEADAIWTKAIDERETTGGLDEDGKLVESKIVHVEDRQLQRALLCARILRNVVVGDHNAQRSLYAMLSLTIEKLWMCTSFAYVNDVEMQTLTRTYVQLISNLVTGNEEMQKKLWEDHLTTNHHEKQRNARSGADLLARLLQSKDAGTSVAGLILLLNCTLGDESRCDSLSSTISGRKIIEAILTAIQERMDKDDESGDEIDQQGCERIAGAASQSDDEFVTLCFKFFSNLFDRKLFLRIYSCLAPAQGAIEDIAIISPSQLTLLKLLDSYLHLGAKSYGNNTVGNRDVSEDLLGLVAEMSRLSRWAEEVMKASMKGGSRADIDVRLVDVHVGLILHLQILISLGLKTEDVGSSDTPIGHTATMVLSHTREASFLQTLVSLLHISGQFSPAISPFRPRDTSAHKQSLDSPPEGHFLSSTGLSSLSDGEDAGPSLDNLKRDIVNLLGVLAFQRGPLDKREVVKVQDVIRETGGLVDVLSMTQLDEKNPCESEKLLHNRIVY